MGKFCFHSMISLAVVLAGVSAVAAEATGMSAKPIVVYNEDDSNFIGGDGTSFSNYLNSICRGTVTHFFFCPNSMRSNIGTKSIEPIWKALEEPWAKPDGRCPAFKRLHDAGIDPYQFYIGAARAKGVSSGISMRMNDHHWVTEPDYCALSDFWRAHPEFRREQTQPQKGRWNWEDYNFDYAHKEVRDYFLAYVAELLERYDVDVFECDWLRCTMCLRAGREAADAHFIGEFMREVRKRTDAAAARRGHPVRVCVRVCPVVATNLAIGYDVIQWVRDGSVDWVVGCNDWDCANFDIDVAGWESAIAATGRDVLFIPGLDRNVRESYALGSAKHNLSRAEYLAWCDGVFAKGAKGVYLFNLFGIERSRGVWDAALNGDILPPKCRAERRVYPIWHDDMDRPPRYPRSLAESAHEVEFYVGAAPTNGVVAFRCAFTGRVVLSDAGRFSLNGSAPLGVTRGDTHRWAESEGKVESEWNVFFPIGAVRPGYNRVRLPQLQGAAFTSGCLDLDPNGTYEPDCPPVGEVAKTIRCEGEYPYHLQGVATDGENLYWSFTDRVVKTDKTGKRLCESPVGKLHFGDLCVIDEKVYVAFNGGRFNEEAGAADSRVIAFRADDLKPLQGWNVPEVVHGAGGIAYHDGLFYVVGGLPKTHTKNYVYVYTPDFKFVRRIDVESGYTTLGVQTIDFVCGSCLLGIYPVPKSPVAMLRCPLDFSSCEEIKLGGYCGMVDFHGQFFQARTEAVDGDQKRQSGVLLAAELP